MQSPKAYGRIADHEIARDMARIQSIRDASFPSQLFVDPTWNILLALYLTENADEALAIDELCLASGVPASAALRWLLVLEDNGMVSRLGGAAQDARSAPPETRVGLTPKALDHFTMMFTRIREFD